MNRLAILLINSFLFLNSLFAQSDGHYSQYMFNKFALNPAYAGSKDLLRTTALYRTQWLGFEGQPASQSISADLPILPIKGGIGLVVNNDVIGAERTTNFMFAYAFRKKIGVAKLSLGISIGGLQKTLDGRKLITPSGTYSGEINHNDQILPTNLISTFSPDVNTGIAFEYKQFTFGASLLHLPQFNSDFKGLAIKTTRQLFFTSSYRQKISKDVDITPSVLIAYNKGKMQQTINMLVYYKKDFWAGVAIRGLINDDRDALTGMLGLNIKEGLSLGYAYDFSISNLTKFNSGSHEIVLNYLINFSFIKTSNALYSPRFM